MSWLYLVPLIALVLNLLANYAIIRSIKARGHWVVTIGGPRHGESRWVPPKRASAEFERVCRKDDIDEGRFWGA